MIQNQEVGKRIIDLTDIVANFEADEGDVEHIIGKTGQGKTYEATRRALRYLRQGSVLYTTWRLNLPEYFDERDSIWHLILNTLLFRKVFHRFDYRKNWHHINLDDYMDDTGVFDTEKFAIFLATRTDCIFMLDEGQDVFDSHQRAGKIARQTITRTRHMHKKLILISQRAQAVDVTARGNVTYFYRCTCLNIPFLPKYFKVHISDEIDNAQNYPIWERHDSTGKVVWKAPLYYSGFARKSVYAAYDSWYMRKNMVRSQDIHLLAYELTLGDKIKAMYRYFKKGKAENEATVSHEIEPKVIHRLSTPVNVLDLRASAIMNEYEDRKNRLWTIKDIKKERTLRPSKIPQN
jgi:hypothetical protein